jgi:carbon dioxide concentrating mechanism protein CcmM
VEAADKRRFKTSSWLTVGTLSPKSYADAVSTLQTMLLERQGEYVRLIGIDTKSKRRISETIIQRPDDNPGNGSLGNGNGSAKAASSVSRGNGSNGGGLSNQVKDQVRSLLAQGYKIGAEHADKRRFKTSSWISCSPIDSTREAEVFAALEGCIRDHAGEYVRLIGIDSKAKRRVLETVIQRPGESGVSSSSSSPSPAAPSASNGGGGLDAETLQQVRSLLAQGYKIGTEHADKRRFKTSSWISCSPIDTNNESAVVAALQGCLRDHQGEYVRLIGIDTKAKRRVLETVIQRP